MGLFPLPDPAGEGAFGLGDVAAVDGEPLRDGRAGRSAADVALGVGEPLPSCVQKGRMVLPVKS